MNEQSINKPTNATENPLGAFLIALTLLKQANTQNQPETKRIALDLLEVVKNSPHLNDPATAKAIKRAATAFAQKISEK